MNIENVFKSLLNEEQAEKYNQLLERDMEGKYLGYSSMKELESDLKRTAFEIVQETMYHYGETDLGAGASFSLDKNPQIKWQDGGYPTVYVYLYINEQHGYRHAHSEARDRMTKHISNPEIMDHLSSAMYKIIENRVFIHPNLKQNGLPSVDIYKHDDGYDEHEWAKFKIAISFNVRMNADEEALNKLMFNADDFEEEIVYTASPSGNKEDLEWYQHMIDAVKQEPELLYKWYRFATEYDRLRNDGTNTTEIVNTIKKLMRK